MEFPKDHYTHDDTIEWWYFWGKFSDGRFFHFAIFRAGKGSLRTRASHWSLHNKKSEYFEELEDDFNSLKYAGSYVAKEDRFSINSKHFGLTMFPNGKPIIHQSQRNYYTIPSLSGEGYTFPAEKVTSDIWMDHEFGRYRTLSDWEWLGIKLDCGLNLMVTLSAENKLSMIENKSNLLSSDFILDGKHLFFHALSMYLILEPTVEEKIFNPKFGIPYSEQPFNVISKGGIIGHGMRERTYKREKIDGKMA